MAKDMNLTAQEIYEKEFSWNQLRPDRAEMLCHNPAGNI